MLDIKIQLTETPKEKPAPGQKLGFGKIFTDHMFVMNYTEGKGFSLVEVVSACPTNWGMTPQKALEWVESDMLPYYPIGVYKDRTAAKEAAD